MYQLWSLRPIGRIVLHQTHTLEKMNGTSSTSEEDVATFHVRSLEGNRGNRHREGSMRVQSINVVSSMSIDTASMGLALDGFPRTSPELIYSEAMCVNLTCSESTLVSRIADGAKRSGRSFRFCQFASKFYI